MKNKVMYIILIILVFIIGLGSYIIYQSSNKKTNEQETNENKKAEEILVDGVKLIRTKKENDRIVQEYEVILNGKKNILEISYIMDVLTEIEKDFGGKTYEFLLKGKINFQNENLYTLHEETDNLENYFNIDYINTNFNEKNFVIIKGQDTRNYLTLSTINNNRIYDSLSSSYIYVYNDNLELINKDDKILTYSEAQGLLFNCDNNYEKCDIGDMWYEDKLNLCYEKNGCQIRTKIEKDKIYSLTQLGDKCISEGVLEERVYNINNNKLEYKVINTYSFNGIAGAC